MKTRSTQEKHGAGTATEQLDPRLNYSNVQEREAHIRAFFAWLPQILHEAPGIQWERLPSQVIGYLIRTVADNPDAISITLAVGSAMDAMKPKSLYGSCQSVTNLLKRLRSHYGMTTLAELAERSTWDQFVAGRMISPGELIQLKRYDTLAALHVLSFFEGLTARQQVMWKRLSHSVILVNVYVA